MSSLFVYYTRGQCGSAHHAFLSRTPLEYSSLDAQLTLETTEPVRREHVVSDV